MGRKNVDSIFRYDSKTGYIFWVICSKPERNGSRAEYINGQGYIRIRDNGKEILGHRLAWRLHYGKWPKGHIDHINGIKTDNRISNLRVVDARQNGTNRWTHIAGRLPGASRVYKSDKWRAYIVINGKHKHIGCFKTEKQASLAYKKELKCLAKATK